MPAGHWLWSTFRGFQKKEGLCICVFLRKRKYPIDTRRHFNVYKTYRRWNGIVCLPGRAWLQGITNDEHQEAIGVLLLGYIQNRYQFLNVIIVSCINSTWWIACFTCLRALRSLHALVPCVSYVPSCRTCLTCPMCFTCNLVYE